MRKIGVIFKIILNTRIIVVTHIIMPCGLVHQVRLLRCIYGKFVGNNGDFAGLCQRFGLNTNCINSYCTSEFELIIPLVPKS